MTLEFAAWPKTPRWANEEGTITEKIDGTNACIVIHQMGDEVVDIPESVIEEVKVEGDTFFTVQVQSRNRFITPGKNTDNAGFAGYVAEHVEELVRVLGPGRHYGEWWGRGIQRGYGQDTKKFSLFTPWRYDDRIDDIKGIEGLGLVPILYQGVKWSQQVEEQLHRLEEHGSVAAPGFIRPEGVIVQTKLTRLTYKAFVGDDGIPKSMKEGN